MADTKINENAVYEYCKGRWDYYKTKDGKYSPSKHDSKVFEDTSKEFGITPENVKTIFSKIDKVHVQQMHIEKMSKSQMADLFKEIVEENAETPWGCAHRKSEV